MCRYVVIVDETLEIIIKKVILNIHSIPNEKAQTIKERILQSINTFQVSEKIYGYLADNAPVNFGSLTSTSGGMLSTTD